MSSDRKKNKVVVCCVYIYIYSLNVYMGLYICVYVGINWNYITQLYRDYDKPL